MDTRPLTWAALAFAFFSLFIFLGGPGSTQSVRALPLPPLLPPFLPPLLGAQP